MTEKELQKYRDPMNECWKLFKKYATSGDPEDIHYWDNLIQDVDTLYQNCDLPLIRSMLLATIKELDILYKEKKRSR